MMDPDGLAARGRRPPSLRRRRAARGGSKAGAPALSRFLLIPLAGFCAIGGYLVWARLSVSMWSEDPLGGPSVPDGGPSANSIDAESLAFQDPTRQDNAVDEMSEIATDDAVDAYAGGEGSSSSQVEGASVDRDDEDGASFAPGLVEPRRASSSAGASARAKRSGGPPSKALRGRGASPPAEAKQSAEGEPVAEGKPAAAPPQGNLFTLVVEGRLGGKRLSGNDQQTWARLGYFLREEAARPFFLVFSGGSMPLIVPASSAAGPKAAPTAKESKRPAAAPAGDPALPDYRLVVRASSQAEGDITFYGRSMASKYRCDISCSIERRSDKSFREIDRVSATELWTPSTAHRIDGPAALRKVYDVCLDRLVKRLAERPFFTRK